MSVDLAPPRFTFCIDTNKYSGNFERETCAYVTGVYGDCEVGMELAKIAREELRKTPFWDPEEDDLTKLPAIVCQIADEHGCYRPASIGETPGFWNDGFGGHYPDSEWENRNGKILDDLKVRMRQDAAGYKDTVNHWIYEERMKDADEATIDCKFPACQTVEIFLDERPSDDLLKLMMERARHYSVYRLNVLEEDDPYEIIGFRLVERELMETEVGKWDP